MAVNFFGTCSGSSGGKYNIWIEVNENSHSVKNNTSNLTVKLKLKRNDGYTNSAYNLNESENFAKITINGAEKVSKNLKIDTRNNVVVTLCSWSGDVLHDEAGKLTVTIGGTFTMSGTSLGGGVVSGNFDCVTIPRITPFSLDKTSVNCGESVSLSLMPYSANFNHKVIYSINKVNLSVDIAKGTTKVDLVVPIEWAKQILNTNQGIINFELKTYSDSDFIGSTKHSIKLIIPPTEDFLPQFSFLVTDNKNGLVPNMWDAVIQNRSTLTVKINSFIGKFGATLSACWIMVGDVKKYGESAEFELPIAGRIKVKVRVTDSRGLYQEDECIVDVDEYSLPGLIINDIYRCNSDGAPNENDASVSINFAKKYSSVRDLNLAYVKVKYKKYNETEYSDLVQLKSSPFILNGTFERESSYEFVFETTDVLTKTPVLNVRTLTTGTIPFNIKKGGKGAAFGCYAETDNELTVGYDLNIKGNLKNIDLATESIVADYIAVDYLFVRKFECMDITFVMGLVTTKDILPANNWIKILTVPISSGFMYIPISAMSFKFIRDKNLVGYISNQGEIFINGDVDFTKGEKIFFSGFY